ncbi:NAD(P)/FAD-dependent oxidoreductase [Falsirhodobacter algicola]|uniref:NADH:ubiquinone reductase (non-electrogenic) n=1 Tax=Falsirhodobacter algicola TaxID=2692330 RepID=A0A8J8MV62_9RHOB|nr:NAD(P)/FAD-dependent oxidoreductase [Falsirhodobacter algicola]QUS37039.1 FAD-dependent oxidoreductase [Falsirhodobacter algicola]
MTDRPRVVIVGAGFGGLACARALGGSEADVLVLDRRNHSLFTPLLYQVATAALSPSDIAEPIRKALGRWSNLRVELAEVTGIDTAARHVQLKDAPPVPFDHLVIATGSDYDYFGNDDWRIHAPGLKTVNEARVIRQRLLLSYERAEMTEDPALRRALLTHVVIGGGPTGVEMAGAMVELGREIIARDFRRLRPEDLNVVLIEAGPRLLTAFPEDLADYALRSLQDRGVDVRIGCRVEAMDEGGVIAGGERIPTGCIVWGAGVRGSNAAQWLGIAPERGNRLPVRPDMTIEGFPGIYALGDTAAQTGADGRPLPALAQVAKQQGQHLGRNLRALIADGTPLAPFHFRNRGNTAVVGRNAAVFDFGRRKLRGHVAWYLWALVHVYLLVNTEKRVLVSVQWLWTYLTGQPGARLIDETAPKVPVPREQPAAPPVDPPAEHEESIMDDDRVWSFERGLWQASEDRYHERVDPECVMALSRAPHLFQGKDAQDAVTGTPAWDEVSFSDQVVSRPQEGLIVVGYHVRAQKGETLYKAACTSVYRRREHEDWTVVQHAQVALDAEDRAAG